MIIVNNALISDHKLFVTSMSRPSVQSIICALRPPSRMNTNKTMCCKADSFNSDLFSAYVVVMRSHVAPKCVQSLRVLWLIVMQVVASTPHTLRLPMTFFPRRLGLHRTVGLTSRHTNISLVAFRPSVTRRPWYRCPLRRRHGWPQRTSHYRTLKGLSVVHGRSRRELFLPLLARIALRYRSFGPALTLSFRALFALEHHLSPALS